MLQEWIASGNRLDNVVVVSDNAPCHSCLEEVFVNSQAKFLRLAPYSPMLNPLETVWSKLKLHVRTHMAVPPTVAGTGTLTEQRLQYLETLISNAQESIVGGDCTRAATHTTTFHTAITNLEDVPVGCSEILTTHTDYENYIVSLDFKLSLTNKK